MASEWQQHYEAVYKKPERHWGVEPGQLVVDVSKLLSAKDKVLDLGCGEGQDALFLAGEGVKVTAVDMFGAALKKLETYAEANQLEIETVQSDIETFLENDYEEFKAIFMMFSLQFLAPEKIAFVVKRIQDKTMAGGINVIASFVAEDAAQKERAQKQGMYFFDEGELRNFYDEIWEILLYEEKMGDWESHGDGPKHRHYKVEIVARKK